MADIREQDLALKTTIADTDWIRLVTATGNHRMTVGQFKDLIGYTQAKSDISQLQSDVASLVDSGSNPNGTYIRFSDGTQICLMTKVVDMGTAVWQSVPYPATFASIPVSLSASYHQSSITGVGNSFYGNVKNVTLHHASYTGGALLYTGTLQAVTGYAYVQAIGRWK